MPEKRHLSKLLAMCFLIFLAAISIAYSTQMAFVPSSCEDSDSDCIVSNIDGAEGTFETVDLTSIPYGWINITSWNSSIPQDAMINEATLYVLWKTDESLGAGNINIDYWDGVSWTNCAGPFSENSTVSNTSCNVTHLSRNQLNQIKVMLRGEDLDGSPNALGYLDYAYIDVNYTGGMPYLEASLSYPNATVKTNVIQNLTFIVNATVYCRSSECGNVNATLRYNMSSQFPDTDVSTAEGSTPFFIQEASPSATKDCQSNPLGVDDSCTITWTVNTTGNKNDEWKIGVLFTSDNSSVYAASTDNATLSILECTEDFSINWDSLSFGILDPYTGPNQATGNLNDEYNISINPGSCDIDLYIRGTNLTNNTFNSSIDVGRILWNNASNDSGGAYNLTEEPLPIITAAPRNTNITLWYWINVPAIYAGKYNGVLTVTGVKNA